MIKLCSAVTRLAIKKTELVASVWKFYYLPPPFWIYLNTLLPVLAVELPASFSSVTMDFATDIDIVSERFCPPENYRILIPDSPFGSCCHEIR
uniref:Uncharacterized protein n=1 Tax=Arundo donax TaxID=35708 RepID=A0A0A9AE80_ARUDO